ncbi:MAG: MlaD family protein [Aquabacterium sp.]
MKKNALLIGIFVLTALTVIVGTTMLLGRGSIFSKQVPAVVFFEGSVRGLYTGAPVTFRGVKIGEVDHIGIDVDPQSLTTRIPVSLLLSRDAIRMSSDHDGRTNDIPELVRRGLRAKLILQSVVTGQTSIDMDFKPNTPLHLLAGGHSKIPEIPAMRDRLDALLEQISNLPLSELVNDLRHTMSSLDQTLQATQTAVVKSSEQLTRTATQAEKTLAVGAQALQAVQQQATTTLASIGQLSETSRAVVLQTQPELVHTLQSTREAAQQAQAAMANLAELSAPGAPLRADLEAAMRDLSQTTQSLRAFSDELERHPNALVFGKKGTP